LIVHLEFNSKKRLAESRAKIVLQRNKEPVFS
jgi:hypothetical protein